MTPCTEFAVFKVTKENIAQVITLTTQVIEEINAKQLAITDHQIFQKQDNSEELCWQLTWKNIDEVNRIKQLWPTLKTAKALEALVDDKVYYGHFLPLA